MTNKEIIETMLKDFNYVIPKEVTDKDTFYKKTLKALYNEFVNEYGDTKEFVTSIFNISVIKDLVDLDTFNKAITETLGA